jgi:hypothetical protein
VAELYPDTDEKPDANEDPAVILDMEPEDAPSLAMHDACAGGAGSRHPRLRDLRWIIVI